MTHTARCVSTLALFLALFCGARTGAQQGAPSAELKAAVKELIAEAEAIIQNNDVPKGKPDYASRCTHAVTADEVGMALTQRTHRDSFVDAYVRWQLTSFDPALPEMDEGAFFKFTDLAPRMIENPRAEPAVVETFERVDKAGRLPVKDVERVRIMYDELDVRTRRAELLNRPAIEFREFIAAQVGETGIKPRLWLLEELNATVDAGWSTRSIKTRISKSFLDASRETGLPREHIAGLATILRRLVDKNRRFVNEITILADGTVRVTFSTAAVTDNDIEKWTNRLAGVP